MLPTWRLRGWPLTRGSISSSQACGSRSAHQAWPKTAWRLRLPASTELNVERGNVADSVRRCRQSSDSGQARAYRAARHLRDDEGRIAVLVQRMVPAVRSGVAFTINPVTGADEIIVNQVEGLGEALV